MCQQALRHGSLCTQGGPGTASKLCASLRRTRGNAGTGLFGFLVIVLLFELLGGRMQFLRPGRLSLARLFSACPPRTRPMPLRDPMCASLGAFAAAEGLGDLCQ